MAKEAMLAKAPIDPKQVHRIKARSEMPREAAVQYEDDLRASFGLAADELPRFDLVLLGMGPEGHTASLFPGTKALKEERQLVVSNWVGKLYTRSHHPHSAGSKQCGAGHLHGSRRGKGARVEGGARRTVQNQTNFLHS